MRLTRHQRNRCEIRRIGSTGIGHGQGGQNYRLNMGQHQHMTVGWSARDIFRGHHASGARLILDNHRLAPSLLEALRELARHDVGAATGRKADNDLDHA